MRSSARMSARPANQWLQATTRWWLTAAALGRPVVPEVKISSARSASVVARRSPSSSGAPLNADSARSTRRAASSPPWRQTSSGSPAKASAQVSANGAATIAARAPATLTQWASAGAGEVDVEQRDDDADLGQAEPQGEILGPRAHHQRDDVALGEPGGERPARIAIGALGERAEAELFDVAEHGGRVAVGGGPFAGGARQGAGGIARRLGRRLQRLEPGAGGRRGARPRRGRSHSSVSYWLRQWASAAPPSPR